MIKGSDRLSLGVESFDNNMPSEHFFYMAIHMPQVFLLLHKIFLRFLNNHADNDHRQRYGNQGNQRHRPADRKHHDQDTDDAGR